MSYDASEAGIDERVRAMLEVLDEDDLRYQALKGAVEFQAAWLELAELMHEVDQTEAFREWGFRSFGAYCTNELRLSKSVAGKLLEGYQWIENQAPEYLPKNREEELSEGGRTIPRPVPDVDTVSVLAKAHRDVQDERLPEATYAELKSAALRGERSLSELRKEFKEAVPEHLRPEPPAQHPVKFLRRALNEVEKALAQIDDESDNELLTQASALRDAIFEIVSRHTDE